jgi:glycosyltransferase involved in cell wall biosynthesis
MNFQVLLLVWDSNTEFLKNSIESIRSNEKFSDHLTVFLPEDSNYIPAENISYQTYDNNIPLLHYILTWLTKHSLYDAYVFINAGVCIPQSMDERLSKFIEKISPGQEAFTISPLSPDNIFAPLKIENSGFYPSVSKIDSLCYFFSHKSYFQTPFFYHECFCITQKTLQLWTSHITQIKKQKKLINYYWTLSQLTSMQGTVNFCIDYLYVENRNNLYDFTEKEFLLKQISVKNFIINQKPISLQQQIKEAAKFITNYRYLENITKIPVQLHLIHDWGGGLERWAHDYCLHDNKRINLILRPSGSPGLLALYGQEFTLYLYSGNEIILRKWRLSSPINATDISNSGYKKLLDEIICDYKIDAILVSSLIGHSLDVLKTSLPTLFICHDYYPFCQAIHIYYEGTCRKCDAKKLASCHKHNSENFLFKNTPQEWLNLRQLFIKTLHENKITFIYPSASVKNNYEILEPSFKKIPSVLISHGLNLQLYHQEKNIFLPKLSTSHENNFKIIILGRLPISKGLNLIKQIYSLLEANIQLFLIGCGEEAAEIFIGKKNVHLISSYQNKDLPHIIREIDPHLGLLLSIVPETFSYTLSELMVLKIPVLATNAGSFSERIEDNINGFICEPVPKLLFKKIQYLKNHPEILEKVKLNIKLMKLKSIEVMIAEYHEILPITPKRDFNETLHNISSIPIEVEFSPELPLYTSLPVIYHPTSWRIIMHPRRIIKGILRRLKKILRRYR